MRTRPAASCNGFSTGIAAIVVQFGLAMIRFFASATSSGFTSETISGTSGFMRQADELSITIAPAFAYFSASARDVVAPAENNTTSSPCGSASAASSTTICWPFHSMIEPAERADANNRSVVTGYFRSASNCRITVPTIPVAPTIPTCMAIRLTQPHLHLLCSYVAAT